MNKISATILTFNEQERVAECIASLQGVADEIIVVDSFSTDDTVAICESLGCKVTCRRMNGFGAQRQYATSLARYDHVLSIDADEVLSETLRQSLMDLKREGFDHRGYSFSRLNFYCGVPVRHSGWYPDRQVRLFDKRYANWNLHGVAERVIFRDNVQPVEIEGDLLHYRCSTPEEYIATEQRHASIAAAHVSSHKMTKGRLSRHLHALKNFLLCYIFQGAALDGKAGRAISSARYRTTVTALRGASGD